MNNTVNVLRIPGDTKYTCLLSVWFSWNKITSLSSNLNFNRSRIGSQSTGSWLYSTSPAIVSFEWRTSSAPLLNIFLTEPDNYRITRAPVLSKAMRVSYLSPHVLLINIAGFDAAGVPSSLFCALLFDENDNKGFECAALLQGIMDNKLSYSGPHSMSTTHDTARTTPCMLHHSLRMLATEDIQVCLQDPEFLDMVEQYEKEWDEIDRMLETVMPKFE